MIKRRLWAGLVLWVITVLPLPAATVSFLVIETGLPSEMENNVYSSLWESGLFDVFFEAGHIVSNAPIKRLDKKPQKPFPDEVRKDLNEAADGGAEYFILALLDYPQAAANETPKPRNISLRIFKVSPYKLLYEQRYSDKASADIDEEFVTIKQSIRGLVPHLADK
ncbi:MAG: hypothetical protein LBE14_06565 [Treponema sp.]|jgi:hypothetical protein|nr:hypothetical protein [Treponema sp.]